MTTESQESPPDVTVSPSKRKRLVLAIAGGALLLAAIAGGSLLEFYPRANGRTAATKSGHVAVAFEPAYVLTPEMVTNLDAGPHRITFAKIQCRIEVDRPGDAALVNAAMPRLVDMIQTYLRATRPEELRSDEGTYRLHEALLARASIAVPTAAISDVLFQELITQ